MRAPSKGESDEPQTRQHGRPQVAAGLHDAASNAFFHGFSIANLIAGGIAAAGGLMVLVLLPAHPGAEADDLTPELRTLATAQPAAETK